MFCVWVVLLPLPSSKVQVTTEVPCVVRVSGSLVVPTIRPSQASVAVGAAGIVAEHSPVASGSVATLGTGSVVSSMTMFWVWVVVLPDAYWKGEVTDVEHIDDIRSM